MNYFRRQTSQRRTDRAHTGVRAPRSRRLAIEQIESRVMLSGDGLAGLDSDTFNIGEYGVGYVVISDDAAPPINNAVDSDSTAPLVTFRDLHGDTVVRGNFGAVAGGTGNSASFDLAERLQTYRDLLQTGSVTYFAASADSTNFGSVVISNITLDRNSLGPPFGDLHEAWKSALLSGDSAYLTIDVVAPQPAGELAGNSIETIISPPLANPIRDALAADTKDTISLPVETLRPTGSGPTIVVSPIVPPNSVVTIGHSDAQIDVGKIVDDLLGYGDSVDHVLSLDSHSWDDGTLPVDGDDQLQANELFDAPGSSDAPLVADGGNLPNEGGMIPIQGLVGVSTDQSIAAPVGEQVAAADMPAELSGELSRVAVMELIAGEADPAAPQPAADHTILVAAADNTFAPSRVAGDGPSEALASLRSVAEQTGLAASLVAPANPVYLATMLSAAGDAFAAAAMSAPLSTAPSESGITDARSEAFSQWDNTMPQGHADENEDGASYGLLPLVGVLAMERLVATKRKQKQDANAAPLLPTAIPRD